MVKSKIWRLLAMLLAFSLVAAACGSGDDPVATDDGTETTETTEPEATDDGEITEDDAAATDDGEMTEDDGETTESATVEAAPTCTGESDGILQIGGLLPQTGNLAFLGPPEEAGAALAVQDINAAGGVNGADVVFSPGDSSDSGDVANQTVDRLLAEGVDVVLGAASSGVSSLVIDKITQNCKIHFSPANTSPTFTDYADDDLYFRTAPSDILQGRVLANLIVNEGNTTVTLLALQDPYGEGLLRFTKEPLEEQGVEVVEDFVYDPTAQNFDAEVQKVIAAGADAVVIIGFDETATILTGLFESGLDGTVYLVDGNMSNSMGSKFTEPGALLGIKGTIPGSEINTDFKDRLLSVDPALVDFSYGPETYDAVIISALAAQAAGSDNPAEMAAVMNGVTRDGEKCTNFADCKALLEAGTDIDYDGPSGPQAFGPAGEPTEANFGIYQYGDDNQLDLSLTTYEFAQL